jgi:hypothetical protein
VATRMISPRRESFLRELTRESICGTDQIGAYIHGGGRIFDNGYVPEQDIFAVIHDRPCMFLP